LRAVGVVGRDKAIIADVQANQITLGPAVLVLSQHTEGAGELCRTVVINRELKCCAGLANGGGLKTNGCCGRLKLAPGVEGEFPLVQEDWRPEFAGLVLIEVSGLGGLIAIPVHIKRHTVDVLGLRWSDPLLRASAGTAQVFQAPYARARNF